MPSFGTDNTTSFARDTLAAAALILDALAVTGADRRSLLTQAQTLLYAACANSGGAAELAVPSALVEVIKGYERSGDSW